MRPVFTSARIENAEAVARMLEAEGIEVRIENGSSYRNRIRGNFSYRESANPGPKPTVWVIRSDDLPRARQLLREAGLLASEPAASAFLPQTPHGGARYTGNPRQRASRYRYGLVILAAIVAAAIWLRPEPDGTAPVATGQVVAAADTEHVLPVPHALAAAVAAQAAAGHAGTLCLSVDGAPATDAVLGILRAEGAEAYPADAEHCGGDGVLHVDVREWRTDGSGSGEVAWSAAAGGDEPVARTLRARRDGSRWLLGDTP